MYTYPSIPVHFQTLSARAAITLAIYYWVIPCEMTWMQHLQFPNLIEFGTEAVFYSTIKSVQVSAQNALR